MASNKDIPEMNGDNDEPLTSNKTMVDPKTVSKEAENDAWAIVMDETGLHSHV